MSEFREGLPTNPTDRLRQFVTDEHARMEASSIFLADALPFVDDLQACNECLVEAGRDDLTITSPAAMMKVESPLEILEQSNNFVPKFQMSPSEAELDRLAAGAPAPESQRFSHALKPAYARMLILFPDFTRKLTLDFSVQGHGDLSERYRAELFAAYQLMSRLVDQNDKHVMRDGNVDPWYLCR